MTADKPRNSSREPREDVTLRTREIDKGRWARFRVWWMDGGRDLVVGILACFASVVCIVLAPLVYGVQKEQAKTAKATAAAAKVSCLRSRTLGPKLADYYASDPAFPREVLAEYRRTIPKVCPK